MGLSVFLGISPSLIEEAAADVITAMGYTDVYSITDGFEGGKRDEGDSQGLIAMDGWRHSGLPWGYNINP